MSKEAWVIGGIVVNIVIFVLGYIVGRLSRG